MVHAAYPYGNKAVHGFTATLDRPRHENLTDGMPHSSLRLHWVHTRSLAHPAFLGSPRRPESRPHVDASKTTTNLNVRLATRSLPRATRRRRPHVHVLKGPDKQTSNDRLGTPGHPATQPRRPARRLHFVPKGRCHGTFSSSSSSSASGAISLASFSCACDSMEALGTRSTYRSTYLTT